MSPEGWEGASGVAPGVTGVAPWAPGVAPEEEREMARRSSRISVGLRDVSHGANEHRKWWEEMLPKIYI